GMEVHVHHMRHPAQRHLREPQCRARAYGRRRDMGGLGGPDRLEKAVERAVVGKAAEKDHRGVAMGVDEAGQDDPAPGVDDLARLDTCRLRHRPDGRDAPFGDRHGTFAEGREARVHRQHMTVGHEHVAAGGKGGHAVASDRAGIRSRISARSFGSTVLAASQTSASVVTWGLATLSTAMFVTAETARTRSPRCRAAMTSGTVDMPTRSQPASFRSRISAGGSKLGPTTWA